ncbi:MAB_1171c family putative transporter [Streptomyces sp. NPDC049915]|uniref:MAB_1171c family putative transporter n=1 Tax=Streptomyces sp. NPDC049915 TaxID=3155510 RepID=UPI00342F43DF
MTLSFSFHVSYAVPTVLLAVALLLKLPTFLRAWRDPEVLATTLLLFWATSALVVIIPVNIERLNRLTGVPNIAAPWAYSFLTASCATGLTMIMRWREEPSPRRRRRIRRIYWIYAGIIAALWVTFILADAPHERIYDLDTYYANTPWMREHILLYLGAHVASCLTAVYMLWKWFHEVENPWLKTGVVLLQIGFASGLVFDAAKLTAITARWGGADWDWLSTKAAPPFALTEAALMAAGFIIPQAGPAMKRLARDQSEYLRLRPLHRALRVFEPAAASTRFGLWIPLDLRLLQRQQRIHDALRLLAPYLDTELYCKAYTQAAHSQTEAKARAIAGAVAVRDAITGYNTGRARHNHQLPQISNHITEHLSAISTAFYRPGALDRIRQRVTTTESSNTHA